MAKNAKTPGKKGVLGNSERNFLKLKPKRFVKILLLKEK